MYSLMNYCIVNTLGQEKENAMTADMFQNYIAMMAVQLWMY